MIPAKIKKSKWHLATVERNRTVSVGWSSRLSLLVCDSKPATLVNDLNLELSWTWVQIPPPPPFCELLNNMKHLLENWRDYIKEDVEGGMTLYHVSSTPDIEVLDPAIAAKNVKTYTNAEYKAWDRPRVFFFTKWGQEDVGIGRIRGNVYEVEVSPNQLYPLAEDPNGYYKRSKEEYEEHKARYKEMREMPDYYPVNLFEMVATLAGRDEGAIGFIYPQQGQANKDIVALWEPVSAKRSEKSFY